MTKPRDPNYKPLQPHPTQDVGDWVIKGKDYDHDVFIYVPVGLKNHARIVRDAKRFNSPSEAQAFIDNIRNWHDLTKMHSPRPFCLTPRKDDVRIARKYFRSLIIAYLSAAGVSLTDIGKAANLSAGRVGQANDPRTRRRLNLNYAALRFPSPEEFGEKMAAIIKSKRQK